MSGQPPAEPEPGREGCVSMFHNEYLVFHLVHVELPAKFHNEPLVFYLLRSFHLTFHLVHCAHFLWKWGCLGMGGPWAASRTWQVRSAFRKIGVFCHEWEVEQGGRPGLIWCSASQLYVHIKPSNVGSKYRNLTYIHQFFLADPEPNPTGPDLTQPLPSSSWLVPVLARLPPSRLPPGLPASSPPAPPGLLPYPKPDPSPSCPAPGLGPVPAITWLVTGSCIINEVPQPNSGPGLAAPQKPNLAPHCFMCYGCDRTGVGREGVQLARRARAGRKGASTGQASQEAQVRMTLAGSGHQLMALWLQMTIFMVKHKPGREGRSHNDPQSCLLLRAGG